MNTNTVVFDEKFGKYVCPGSDTIKGRYGDITVVARLEYDEDTTPMDYDQEGWCFDTTDPDHGEENKKIIESWKKDEWQYAGIVVDLIDEDGWKMKNAASCWGVECNWPGLLCQYSDDVNQHLNDIAQEVAEEAISEHKRA